VQWRRNCPSNGHIVHESVGALGPFARMFARDRLSTESNGARYDERDLAMVILGDKWPAWRCTSRASRRTYVRREN